MYLVFNWICFFCISLIRQDFFDLDERPCLETLIHSKLSARSVLPGRTCVELLVAKTRSLLPGRRVTHNHFYLSWMRGNGCMGSVACIQAFLFILDEWKGVGVLHMHTIIYLHPR